MQYVSLKMVAENPDLFPEAKFREETTEEEVRRLESECEPEDFSGVSGDR